MKKDNLGINMATPTKIKLNKQDTLTINWDTGEEYTYPLKFLRDESPDAQNKGETILWKHYAPPVTGPDKPGKYEIENIEMVGGYAIKIKWKDGYDYGIYSFELLARLGEFLEVKETLPKDSHYHNRKNHY